MIVNHTFYLKIMEKVNYKITTQNSTKLTCLEITGYGIKYSTVLWLLELQMRRGQKVHSVNSSNRTSNCQCSLFPEKNPIIWIFWISGLLAIPINLDKWISTVVCVN